MNLRILRRLVCLAILAVLAGCTCVSETPAKKPPKKKLEVRKEPLRPFLAPAKSGTGLLRLANGRKEKVVYEIERAASGVETVRRTFNGRAWEWRLRAEPVRTIQLLETFAEGSLTSFDFEAKTAAGTFAPCLRVTSKLDDAGIRKTHYYYCEKVGLARIERIDGLTTSVDQLEKAP